jgi:trehalose-phosphatase
MRRLRRHARRKSRVYTGSSPSPESGQTGLKRPLHLFRAWADIAPKVRRAERLALFTDFDGTLVAIPRWPWQVRFPAQVRKLLAELERKQVILGVISGRGTSDVRNRVRMRRIWYVGAHGFFLCSPGNRRYELLNLSQRRQIASAHRALRRKLQRLPGVVIEFKKAAIALHYRNASTRARAIARAVAASVLEAEPGLCLLAGKNIWEIRPASGVDKWTAIQFILRREHMSPSSGRCLVFYLGDDTTDESVFRKLRGITIAVGPRRPTAARFHLRSPREVQHFLKELNALR